MAEDRAAAQEEETTSSSPEAGAETTTDDTRQTDAAAAGADGGDGSDGSDGSDGAESAEDAKPAKPAKAAKAKKSQGAKGTKQTKGGGREGKGKKAASDEPLYTLTEVSEQTGISMPTLQRYKKEHQDRIPSVGKGRRQRYPSSSFEVFEEIKAENISRRGRPKKKGSGSGKAKRQSSKRDDGLLTLTRVAEETGISYPTLVRYVKLHKDRIPFEGTGRSRRYHPEAIRVFQQIRAESPRGRRRKGSGGGSGPSRATDATLARRVQALERSQAGLEKQIKELIKEIKKPLKVTIRR